jgi:hypothetical protein
MHASDGVLAQELALRAAMRGFIGFVLWSDSFAASGPANDAPWFARGRLRRAIDDGFLIACTASEMRPTDALREALEAFGVASVCVSIADQEAQSMQTGLTITRAEFDALALAGRALLLPETQETRVLDPGVDPLKTF